MSDKIFEIGAAGLETTDTRVKNMVQNMVNAETPGFKEGEVQVKSFPLWLEQYSQKYASMKPAVENTYRNFNSGSLIKTGGPTDLALSGNGFFVVQGNWGEGYTRDGRFKLNVNGQLVSTAHGYPLMGEGGPMVVTPGAKVEITQSGEIKVEGNIIDKIRVVKFSNPDKLESLGGSFFRAVNNTDPGLEEVLAPTVLQGYIESSNVNMINKMMELIYLERAYGINTKVIQNRDATMTRALEMGRVNQ